MRRVGTLDIMAAEEGTTRTVTTFVPSAHPGWRAPDANVIATLVKAFVIDETEALRRQAERHYQVAREHVDRGVSAMVSSQQAPLLPTTAQMAVPHTPVEQWSGLDAAMAAV